MYQFKGRSYKDEIGSNLANLIYRWTTIHNKKDDTRLIVMKIEALYYAAYCLLGPETIETIDASIDRIYKDGALIGLESLRRWMREVYRPMLRDRQLIKILMYHEMIEVRDGPYAKPPKTEEEGEEEPVEGVEVFPPT